MVITMHKNSTKYPNKIIKELSLLRKGRGVSPAKMTYCSLLREIAAGAIGVDSNSITNSQAHNLLLAEIAKLPSTPPSMALRYAFSLAEEAKNFGSLTQRRAALAKALNKHTDTIIRYENQAIGELAQYLVDSHNTALKPLTSPSHSVTILESQHRNIMRDTVILNLPGFLPVANRAHELVDLLEQSQRPFLEMSVEIKFLPSSRGNNWYRLEARYAFSGTRNMFRIAAVMDSRDGERLMTHGLIDEFHELNNKIDPTQEMRSIINTSCFIAYNHSAKSRKLFRFKELEPMQTDRLIQSIGEPLKAQCRLLEVIIPSKWQEENITYEYRSTLNLRDDIHYAYWYAPSMMYVKKLVFDYSDFPGVDSWNFIVMPFLGNLVGEGVRTPYSFVAHPNNWIMPGHGIALVWEAKPEVH